jgi:hypothetical protein
LKEREQPADKHEPWCWASMASPILSTVLDDFSRYIVAWKLCATMCASDVTATHFFAAILSLTVVCSFSLKVHATRTRRSIGAFGSRIMPSRNSSGLVAGCAETAARAAFLRTVLRLGVPRCLPPRLSPGFDPLGIAMFATFAISLDRFFRTLRSLLLLLSLNSASLELGGTAHLRNHLKESLDRPLVVSRGVVQVSAANPEHRSDRGNEPDTPDARNDFHLR